MNRYILALRLLWRDTRSGDLTILILALTIAVSSSTAITVFSDRLQRTLTNQTADFLAGDLVISSTSFISHEWLDKDDPQPAPRTACHRGGCSDTGGPRVS